MEGIGVHSDPPSMHGSSPARPPLRSGRIQRKPPSYNEVQERLAETQSLFNSSYGLPSSSSRHAPTTGSSSRSSAMTSGRAGLIPSSQLGRRTTNSAASGSTSRSRGKPRTQGRPPSPPNDDGPLGKRKSLAFKKFQAQLSQGERPDGYDSPDPLNCISDWDSPQAPPARAAPRPPARRTKVLSPRHPNNDGPSTPKPDLKKKKKRRPSSDDDLTPRPARKTSKETRPAHRQKPPKRTQSNEDEIKRSKLNNEGNAFFAGLGPEDDRESSIESVIEPDEEEEALDNRTDETTSMGASFFAHVAQQPVKREREKAIPSVARLSSSPRRLRKLERLEIEEEVDEDELYCRQFCDPNNLCRHCSEPLPLNPSTDLIKLGVQLDDVLRVQGSQLSWRRTIAYCTLHRAETQAIPLGRREGYPHTIDFEHLYERLESGFVRARLRRIVAKPTLSKFFRRAQREIDSMGEVQWKAARQMTNETALSIAIPGYYGDLGRAVIIQHFQDLVKWGFLSLASPQIKPLSPSDFIVTVLVPEAAVLLIMEDNGWYKEVYKGAEWTAARERALSVRQHSGQYGRYCFREDGPDGQRVLRALVRTADERRWKFEAAYEQDESKSRRPRVESTKPQSRGRQQPEVIMVPSSDVSDATDPSDFGSEPGDDDFWNQAVTATEDVEQQNYNVMDTPTKPRSRQRSVSHTPTIHHHKSRVPGQYKSRVVSQPTVARSKSKSNDRFPSSQSSFDDSKWDDSDLFDVMSKYEGK